MQATVAAIPPFWGHDACGAAATAAAAATAPASAIWLIHAVKWLARTSTVRAVQAEGRGRAPSVRPFQ